MAQTKLRNLVNPQVMADMISATLPSKIKFSPIAGVDTTLEGVAGNTITVPKFGYVGAAVEVAEGVQMDTTQMSATTTTATVKKVGKAVEITDEAALSGYGQPLNEAARQLTMAIADKVDYDLYYALAGASTVYSAVSTPISYKKLVSANAKFDDENESTAKILFIAPAQEEKLLLDSDFIAADRIKADVAIDGYVGRIAGMNVVKSKKVTLVKYEKDNTSGTITIVATTESEDSTHKYLSTIQPNCASSLVVGDKVSAAATNYYANPIVVVDVADPNENPSADGFAVGQPALTVYMKRNVMVESDRDILAKTTVISADEHYTAVLSNDSKVVLAKFGK